LVGRPEEKRPLGRRRHRWGIILKWVFRKWTGEAWTGLIWLKIGTGGGLLWMRLWTFGFHKMREISWLAENLLASQAGLCCKELVVIFTKFYCCMKNLWSFLWIVLFPVWLQQGSTGHIWTASCGR
jgi:hypothetical protein